MEQEKAEKNDIGDESDSSESVEGDTDLETDKSGEASFFEFEDPEEEIMHNYFEDQREKNRSLNNSKESFIESEDPEDEIMHNYFKDQREKNRSLNNSKGPVKKNRSLNISKDPCENNPEDSKCTLEKAFNDLRNRNTLDKAEEKALIDFADRFVTCTLNPDIAVKMISKDKDISEGREIVRIAKETQTHHHTKTCKKTSPDCRFGMPRYPMWKTILSKPVKGTDEEEKRDRKIKHNEALKAVLGVLEDEKVMSEIWSDYDKDNESKKEYVKNRKQRILRVLEIAGVDPKCYLEAVQEQTRNGVNIILARDVDEMFINNYNPEWILAWNGNIDFSVCLDFFAVITYITDYFTKDESGTSNLLKVAAKQTSEMAETNQKRHLKNVFLANRQMGISEAFMKLLPENHLKDSSIGTEFIPHGKRDDISRYVVRAENSNVNPESALGKILFEIPGRVGLYFEKPNWLEKFFLRGESLLEVCPMQYVKMFDVDSKGGKIPPLEEDCEFAESVKRFGKKAKFHHVVLSNGMPGKLLPDSAEIEEPLPGEPKFMRKRRHPKAIRYFKVKQDNNPVRFFL